MVMPTQYIRPIRERAKRLEWGGIKFTMDGHCSDAKQQF